ncbi:MAG: hypothetical protein Q8L48_28755 [Archangium sp.]|nr:hypothetical protein [Archangium sp.]
MKQAPLFRRQFFVQKPAPGLVLPDAGRDLEYLRLQGHSANPGEALQGQRLFLAAGGTLDLVCEAYGGAGVGRVSYAPGLRAALKRGEDFLTYRFEVPRTAGPGTSYQVSCHGHDQVPAFHFTIEVD